MLPRLEELEKIVITEKDGRRYCHEDRLKFCGPLLAADVVQAAIGLAKALPEGNGVHTGLVLRALKEAFLDD